MSVITPPFPSPTMRRILLHSACARAAYEAAAATLENAGRHVIAHAFAFTARQEAEHTAILQGLLGQAAPPPHLPPADADAAALLSRALRHEATCAHILYPAAWREAEQAGQLRLSAALHRMARTEELHARRFRQYLSALADGTLTRSEDSTCWLCLACGDLHHGCIAPQTCEGCGRGPGHFIRSDFYPFAVNG